jgi:hypothetical protein
MNRILERWGDPRLLKHDKLVGSILPVFSLLAISVLVYGVFIGKLGFYWDDWPLIWVYHSLGLDGVTLYFKGNRPFAGWIYSFLFPYLGMSAIGWHVLALILRWLSSVILFFVFRALWPKRIDSALLISVFALLYPGFSQQALAVTYILQHVSFLLFSISIGATIWSIRSSRGYWLITAISLVAALQGYLIIEYFAGLELIRPIIIVLALRGATGTSNPLSIKEVFAKSTPYLIAILIFLMWRLFFFQTWPPTHDGMSQLSGIIASPLSALSTRLLNEIRNILMASVFAWSRVLSPELLNWSSMSVLFSWAIGMLVAGISILTLILIEYCRRESADAELKESGHSMAWTIFLLGLVALAFGGLPNMYANLVISYNISSFLDRFTLPYLLGSSLALVGLLLMLSSRLCGIQKTVLLSIILFLFSSFQIRTENMYRREWKDQKSFFWQFAWRVPTLKPGTGVYVDQIPFSLAHNHAAGLMNMLYNANDVAGRLDYFIFDLEWLATENQRSFKIGTISVPNFMPGESAAGSLRSFVFRGTTSQSLVMYNSPTGTLRIVDQTHAAEIPGLPPFCRSIAHLSNVAAVVDKKDGLPDGPLLQIFGPEPNHEWSYFYQKAELERQLGFWDKVARLGDEVNDNGYKPKDPSEWFPFIEGCAMTGRYEIALTLTERVLEESPNTLLALSYLWRRIAYSHPGKSPYFHKALDSIRNKLILFDQSLISK